MQIELATTCPHCGNDLDLTADVAVSAAPEVRSKAVPIGTIHEYRFTSEQIKEFVLEKARQYVPDVKMELVPRYCENKRRKPFEKHRGYASLRIAFSDAIIEKKDDMGWYGKIGEDNSNVHVVKSLFLNIIKKYAYNKDDINKWMHSYKTMDELEEAFGMTETYLNDLREYSSPKRIKTASKDSGTSSWIIFAAAAENILEDMLTDVTTGEVAGRLEVADVYPVSKDVVEFLVYLHPKELKMVENPHVRQILLGEEKPKK